MSTAIGSLNPPEVLSLLQTTAPPWALTYTEGFVSRGLTLRCISSPSFRAFKEAGGDEGSPIPGVLYEGGIFYIEETREAWELIHELSHWLVASPEERQQVNFGFTTGKRTDSVFSEENPKVSYKESLACQLTVCWFLCMGDIREAVRIQQILGLVVVDYTYKGYWNAEPYALS